MNLKNVRYSYDSCLQMDKVSKPYCFVYVEPFMLDR